MKKILDFFRKSKENKILSDSRKGQPEDASNETSVLNKGMRNVPDNKKKYEGTPSISKPPGLPKDLENSLQKAGLSSDQIEKFRTRPFGPKSDRLIDQDGNGLSIISYDGQGNPIIKSEGK